MRFQRVHAAGSAEEGSQQLAGNKSAGEGREAKLGARGS